MNDLAKSKIYHRFSIFGWNIYITRHPLRKKVNRSRFRTSQKAWRLEYAGYRCELCGDHINLSCSLYHILPQGAPGRNDGKNLRVICPKCHQFVQILGAYRPMICQKGGEL